VRREGCAVIAKEWFEIVEGLRQKRYTFRFPMADAEGSTGSLGFDLQGDRYSATLPAEIVSEAPPPDLLKSFFDSVPCSVAVRDQEGRNLYVNPTYQRLVPETTEPSQLIGRLPAAYLPEGGHSEKVRRELWIQEDPRPLCTEEGVPGSSDGASRRIIARFGIFDDRRELVGSASVGFEQSLIAAFDKDADDDESPHMLKLTENGGLAS
jgi:PAS domain-containing protein